MDDPMIVILAAASKIGQPAVITMIIVSTIMVLGLLEAPPIGYGRRRGRPSQR
jgi:hypothetical protein